MSIIEAEIEPHQRPLSIRVRLAGPRDIKELCSLLDDGESAREQVLTWLETPGTTLLVAQSEVGVLAVAVGRWGQFNAKRYHYSLTFRAKTICQRC